MKYRVLFLLIFGLIACSENGPNPNEVLSDEEKLDGSISGFVLDENSKGISGVDVSTTPGGYNAVSDSLGQFTIPKVEEGIYELTFTHILYETASLSQVTLLEDQDLTGLEVTLLASSELRDSLTNQVIEILDDSLLFSRDIVGKLAGSPELLARIHEVKVFAFDQEGASVPVGLASLSNGNTTFAVNMKVANSGGRIEIHVLDSENRLMGLDTTSYDGNDAELNLSEFYAGNALPVPVADFVNQAGTPDNEVSINDLITINLNKALADTAFGGSIITAWVNFNGEGYREVSTDTAQYQAPSNSSTISWQVKIMDNDSNTIEQAQQNVSVIEDAPQFVIDGPSPLAINVDGTFSFNGTDTYGSIVSYEWDVGSGYVSGGSSLTHKWLSEGSHEVKLKVTDDDGNFREVTRSINVTNDVPQVQGFSGSIIAVNDQLTFEVAVSDNDGMKYVAWDFGDGSLTQYDTTYRSDSSIVTHLWESFGSFTVKMTLVDSFDLATTDSVVVNVKDFFTDSRDGQRYLMTQIGNQTWMAENLNYDAGTGSYCYDNNTSNCDTYGRLYEWNVAMGGAATSDATPSGVQGVCPSGWHLPSDAEWQVLATYVAIGRLLKANSSLWDAYNRIINVDQFGFSALPGGFHTSGGFSSQGNYGNWWSSTEYDSNNSYYRNLSYNSDFFERYNDFNKSGAFSVRCLKD